MPPINSELRTQNSEPVTTRRAVTLVELTVAMAVMVIVFAAVVPLFRAIRNSWDAREGNADRLQNGRVLVDHLCRQLAKAKKVTSVSDSTQTNGFIEFKGNDDHTYRYDIGANNYVEFGQVGSLADLAGPVSQLRFTCFSKEDLLNPITDGAAIRLVKVQSILTGSTGQGETFTTSVYLRTGTPYPLGTEPPCVALKNTVDWYDGAIDSYRSSQGAYNPASPGSEALVSVNSTSSNRIELSGGTILRGSAYIGPGGNPSTGIKTYDSAQITGTRGVLAQEVDIPDLSAPTGPPFSNPNEGSLSLSGSTVLTLSSNHHYNNVSMWGTSKLRISGHLTILVDGTWQMGDNVALEILSNSSLNLYLKKTMSIWSEAEVNASTGTPSNLRIFMVVSNKTFDMGDDSKVYAILQNPNGAVKVWTNSQFFGKIKAKTLEGDAKIHVDLDADF